MLLRQAVSRTRSALARRVRRITHREEGRKLPREMVAAMTADGDASSYFESMRSRVAAAGATRSASSAAGDGATRAASSAAGDDYVALADEALDNILEKADELSDERDDVEVELSSGVLTLKTPEGTWVLNKQVPNRQLWLSSPVSGPCRYEYVEGTWTHTRDGSSLSELLERELGLIM